MDALRKLRRSRGGHKSHLGKLLENIDALLENYPCDRVPESEDTVRLKDYLRQLEQKATTLSEIDKKILDTLEDEHEFESMIVESEETQSLLSQKMALINHKLTVSPQSISTSATSDSHPPTHTSETVEVSPPTTTTKSDHGEPTSGHAATQYFTRLPKLEVPKYSGDPLNWQSFWDCFESAIHFNSNLSGVQKLSYLRAQLEGDAARVIIGLPLTNMNYEHSVDLLKGRYGKPDKLIKAHIQALLDTPKPANKLASLLGFHDTVKGHVRCLESLGKSPDSLETLLVPIMLGKLPEETKKNMARAHDSSEWTIKQLQDAIMKEVRIFEAGHQTSHSPTQDRLPTASFFTSTGKKSSQKPREYASKQPVCTFCKGSHAPINCEVHKDQQSRLAIIKQEKLCFNCLAHHRVSQCSSRNRCRKCNGKHHTSICNRSAPSGSNPTSSNDSATTTRNQSQSPSNSTASTDTTASLSTIVPSHLTRNTVCLLKTAIATVVNGSVQAEAHILFDEGSQRSFLTEKLARLLEVVPCSSEHISLTSFGSTRPLPRRLDNVIINLKTSKGELMPILALVVPNIAAPLNNTIRTTLRDVPYLQGLPLAHPVSSAENFEISLLVGADFYWNFIGDHVVRGDGPTAVSSRLGYVLSGPLPVHRAYNSVSNFLNLAVSHDTDVKDLQRFWEIEDTGVTAKLSDQTFLEEYCDSHIIRQEDGSYCASFPWRDNHPPLPNNYFVCQGRTRSLVHRLAQTPGMLLTYDRILKEQVDRGFIERVTPDGNSTTHYIPHHPVRKDSSTTPIRIVYDCSCRGAVDQPSLNDCLLTGPPFLIDLVSIILRFRLKKYGVSTDIEKAFLHITLHPKDRDFTRFLWLSNASDPSSKFETYRFCTVLFGSVSSPFMLFATLNHHLQQYDTPVSNNIRHNLYVDNIVTGFDSEAETLQFYSQARSILSAAKFNLRAWASNCRQLRNTADKDDTADQNTLTNVLGLHWNTSLDKLSLTLKGLNHPTTPLTTKREVLQDSSKLFDPLGILSPISVRAKLLMQRLWQQHVMWDEPLDTDILEEWTGILADINKSSVISFDRAFFPDTISATSLQPHVFADASTKAYGAVAYLSNLNQTSFVMAKGRVAPLKQITLPKLELMAAVVAAKLACFVIESLCLKVTPCMWTDSQIVLCWIQSRKMLPAFIKHRVEEIKQLLPNAIWRHCPSSDNPADLLTRGLSFDQFNISSLWWHGPSWLLDESKWPSWNMHSVSQLYIAVLTAEEFVTPTPPIQSSTGLHKVISPDNYSSLERLLAVTAYVQRFIDNLKQSQDGRMTGPLNATELNTARLKWIKASQDQVFINEISTLKSQTASKKSSSLVRQLRLFLDSDGFLRCGGRIHNAPLSDIARFPYLLPQKHGFTKLLIYSLHISLFHGGVNSTLTALRQQYWVPSGRQYIKGLLRRCTTCKRHHGKPYPAPETAPLPKDRLRDVAPFTITGVDFTGALYVQNDHEESKVYICLFTCSTTRAIHLEVVTDLTVQTFLLAFRRFVSRKSLPQVIMSDNASTYLSAAEELKEMLSSEELVTSIGRYGVTWKFIPKRAPWYGGYWERLVGLTKAALKTVLGRAHISLPMLQTLVVEVEATLNDRPLTYLSDDPRDLEPLTPSYLLYGRRITVLPHRTLTEEDIQDPDYGSSDSQMRKDAKRLALLLKHFQTRWKHEYLTSLREFHKSEGKKGQAVKVGDIVQVHNGGARLNWRLAVIEELIVGNDGITRAARIRTSTGTTNRPIVKLYPLEVTSSTATSNVDGTSNSDGTTVAEGNNTDGDMRLPVRAAAKRARNQIREWTQTIRAPPEDVENSDDDH